MKIKQQWDKVCEAYLFEFCTRHGFDCADANWVGGDIGSLAQIGDYFVGMNEIRYDVDSQVNEKMFFLWYDYTMEIHEIQSLWHALEDHTEMRSINYPSFCKGAPLPYSQDELESWRESAKKIEEAKRNFLESFRKRANPGF